MNDFTKDELSYLLGALKNLHANYLPHLEPKIQSMIDSYDKHNAKWIASAHLNEACSLISHAMCLLDMTNDNQ